MLNVDEFESAFRAADKKRFQFSPPEVSTILVINDLPAEQEATYLAALQELLPFPDAEWVSRGGETWSGVEGLLAVVDEVAPDLICTYRNLNSDAWRYRFSLGIYLTALTRSSKLPVLVTPSPHAAKKMKWRVHKSDSILVVTDHLTGDDVLTNWGARLTPPAGTLNLMHVEHDEDFDRIIDAIAKVPEIDTDAARQTIWAQLISEPADYIAHAKQVLEEKGATFEVMPHVMTGHRVADYRALIAEHAVDLVVFPSLEEDRIALHGVAYSLAVELTEVPLLMI